ncbi:hypothetical protein NQ318_004940 [Aromia moschata]|uniref:Uncharacterized protein n=1 Tax=Aromia moschata TaxID=1265417 RepID=A0AAV8X4R1_9CUCU|nr:hypothetical protein NQ318_004940 [Aromia moschata]
MKLIQTAFKSRIASYRVHSENRYSDYNMFFESIKNKVIHLLSEVIKIHNAVKVHFADSKIVKTRASTQPIKLLIAADLNDVFYVFVDLMTTQMSEFEKRDSGWELQFIMYVEINLNKFCAFGGSSYIKLPSFIEKKKNCECTNQDQCFFLWAIISALHSVRERTLDVSLIPPIFYSVRHRSECGNSHYFWIKNLSRLVLSQISNSQHKKYFCVVPITILVMKTYYFNINK